MAKKISDLHGKNIVVYDCEIKNEIGKNGVTWGTHDKMGISVACLFDYRTGDTHVYLDDNLEELAKRLNTADLVVGFNIISFDDKLVRATTGIDCSKQKRYDILAQITKQYGSRVKLNTCLEHNFKMAKTEAGADAPIFYQRKEYGKLISYCLADIRRERMLFEWCYLKRKVKVDPLIEVGVPCPLEMMGIKNV